MNVIILTTALISLDILFQQVFLHAIYPSQVVELDVGSFSVILLALPSPRAETMFLHLQPRGAALLITHQVDSCTFCIFADHGSFSRMTKGSVISKGTKNTRSHFN